jgi:hypothetical protein
MADGKRYTIKDLGHGAAVYDTAQNRNVAWCGDTVRWVGDMPQSIKGIEDAQRIARALNSTWAKKKAKT